MKSLWKKILVAAAILAIAAVAACESRAVIVLPPEDIPMADAVSSATIEVDIPTDGSGDGLPLNRPADASFDSGLLVTPTPGGVTAICSLSVTCAGVLDAIPSDLWVMIPADGVIFKSDNVKITEGESVFAVVLRELTNAAIEIDYYENVGPDSPHIESIANIKGTDAGEGFAWTYEVNGSAPSIGSASYEVYGGDVIQLTIDN
jgi:hypothetical protein